MDQFGPDQAEPRRRIGLACAALRFLVFGPEQVGPGLGEVTRPQPDRGVLPADVSQVSPGAKLTGQRGRFVDGRDRGLVVRPHFGELSQLDQHDRGAPQLVQDAEGGEGFLAQGLGPLHPAEHAAELTPHERHRRPQPGPARSRAGRRR